MKDYLFENGPIKIEKLRCKKMQLDDYKTAHEKLCIACHDVFIEYRGGIILVKRKNFPAKDELWPIGGRINRGFETEQSLKMKAKEECNLDLDNVTFLGAGRTFFETDPFGHGRGTDTVNFAYFARGNGELKLDENHSEYIIVTNITYRNIRQGLHPYVREFIEKAMACQKSKP